MSFFRVLLALLISGGIAYGLYHVVEQQKAELSSRTEIVAERAEITEDVEDGAANTTETPSESETSSTSETETQREAETEDAGAGQATSFAERTAQAVTNAESESEEASSAQPTNTTSSLTVLPSPPAAPNTVADAEPASTGDTTSSLTILPSPPVAPNTGDDEAGATAPTITITSDASDSIDALQIVSSGMAYSEARETLIDAGWTPRALAKREGTPNATETALIDAGYTELKGCTDAERAICRFEFMDGQKRIAAVLTAGSDENPSVIDTFLMNIAKTE